MKNSVNLVVSVEGKKSLPSLPLSLSVWEEEEETAATSSAFPVFLFFRKKKFFFSLFFLSLWQILRGEKRGKRCAGLSCSEQRRGEKKGKGRRRKKGKIDNAADRERREKEKVISHFCCHKSGGNGERSEAGEFFFILSDFQIRER